MLQKSPSIRILAGNFEGILYDDGDCIMKDSYLKIPIKQRQNKRAVKFLNDSILYGIRNDYTEFLIDFQAPAAFSNACAPIAALVNYYKRIHGVQFKFIFADDYVKNIGIDNPLNVSDNINNSKINSPFDKVWVFTLMMI